MTKRIKTNEHKIVRIYWEDAHGVIQEWSDEGIKPLICHSIGYLMEEDDYYLVCPHFNPDTKQHCGSMAIPKHAVKDIEYLGVINDQKN